MEILRTRSIAPVAVVLALMLAGCGSAEVSSGDRPVYGSIEALSADSDAVVVGTVGGVLAREVDEGTADAESSDNGMPMVFYEITVEALLKGQVGDSMALASLDEDTAAEDGSSRVAPGDRLLLFVDELTPAEAPGIQSLELFYVPVGADNGVFDVTDGLVRARTTDVVGLTEEQPMDSAAPVPFVASLADVAAVVDG